MRKAKFASPSGEMYDQNFQRLEDENLYFSTFPPIPNDPIRLNCQMKDESNQGEYDPKKLSDIQSQNRYKYLKSCKNWKTITDTGIIYPVPISLSVYVPPEPFIPTSKTKLSDIRKNPPFSTAYLELFNGLLSGEEIFNQTVSYKQSPIPLSHYLQNSPPWGSKLVPVQPDPNIYPDYNSYKSALNKWITIVPCDEIIQPIDFVEHGLPLAESSTSSSSSTGQIDLGEKKSQTEVLPILKPQAKSLTFDPTLFKKQESTKTDNLFTEKNYFFKTTLPFFFDTAATRRPKNKLRSAINSLIHDDLTSNVDEMEIPLFEKREAIEHLKHFGSFSEQLPTLESTPNYPKDKLHNYLIYLLTDIPKGSELIIFNDIRYFIENQPELVIHCLTSEPTITPMVRIAELFVKFGFLNCSVFQYNGKKVLGNSAYDDLIVNLYGLQTLNIFEQNYNSNTHKTVMDSIKRHKTALMKELDRIFTEQFKLIEEPLKTADPTIMNLLIIFKLDLAKCFPSLLDYLGSLDNQAFNSIAANLWSNLNVCSSLLPYFVETSVSYFKEYRIYLTCNDGSIDPNKFSSFKPLCTFFTYLLNLGNKLKADITAESIMAMLGSVNQFAFGDPEIATPLATSICRYFSNNLKDKSYINMRGIFVNSITTIFEYPDLHKNTIIDLFNIIQNILRTANYDVFSSFFSQILLVKMKSPSNKISKEAWTLFRNIACTDTAKKINKDPNFKSLIESIQIENLTIPAQSILLLIVKKSNRHFPTGEKYKSKNIQMIASLFSSVDSQGLIHTIQQNPKFKLENLIVQQLTTGK